MESKAFLCLLLTLLLSTSVAAESYRWKDKNGELHFGATVPAEYADQPYDIISESGLVIGTVDPSDNRPSNTPEAKAAAAKEKAEAERAEAERQAQQDRLLLIKYPTEEAIVNALQMELDQVGYDSMLINKSYDNTNTAIFDNVRLAADQQRAGIKVSEAQTKEFARMYRNLAIDKKKLSAISNREDEVRAEFDAVLQRYHELVEKYNSPPDQAAEKQDTTDDAKSESKEQS